VPDLPEFIGTVDSEASVAKSPRFEDVTGAGVLTDAPGGVGTALMEEVKVEEEDPDVHFKRKRQGVSRRKRVVKKPRRHTPTAIAESKSATVAPPLALLVIKLSTKKQATDKVIPGLGKTSSIFVTRMYTYTHVYIFFFISSYLMQLSRLTCDSGTEAAGEQGDYYDPLFTYWEGNEASYFVVSEDSEGGVAGVGPSGVGASKGEPNGFKLQRMGYRVLDERRRAEHSGYRSCQDR